MEEDRHILKVQTGPTFRKPRLPKAFSWVIGVERLSERFADLPQFNDVSVWFDDHPVEGTPRPTMTAVARSKLPQQVFTVWYSTIGEPHWYFLVYPVEAGRRSHMRELLEEQAFPAVEQWMKSGKTEVWLQGMKHLRCIWDRVAGRIDIREELR
ncbi:MAG: hypothetical protein PHR35_16565 [Kiritimatiellae bacterium]|nr:hypothetical protein [Kiritimatiellia bacterium]